MLLLYAWLGALVFVLALGYFAYFFVTLVPGPPSQTPLAALVANVLLFGLFAAHHSVMARSGAKRWLQRHLPPEIERATYVWVASVLFVVVCLLWRELPGMVYNTTGWVRWGGLGAQGIGVGIIALAVSTLDPLDLAGVRQAMRRTDGTNSNGQADTLHYRGPYRWVRHPIYLGWVLVVFGAPDMPSTRLAFACISTAYLVIAIPWEERSMAETFGDEYRHYQKNVPWRVVPGVW